MPDTGSDGGTGLLEVARNLYTISGLPVVVHEASRTLLLADIHLGYEDAMASTGVFLPRLQLKMALETIKQAYEMLPYRARVAIVGDLKHVFEKLTRQEKIEITKLVRGLREWGIDDLVLVRGNHDTFVAPILRTLGVELVEDCLDLGGGLVAAHGHRIPGCSYELLVMGHEHPSIAVSVGGARTKLSIMLRVPLEDGSEALVLPPTGIYQTGNNVGLDRRAYLSPLIQEKGRVEDSMVWIVDRDYGTVKLAELKYVLEASI